ncbi:methyltransferase [Methylosinus sp. H3A]|uniref:CmcJ/NvfI family oxidoreductase n=1 Tax=Methylosinus sp. H3A TaxID=2785786 RepID=UPI0018C1DA03|nr:CmcJ/NvfI family oxidoreductase [Methylosinus sp. H3A]MBG0812142.1 methyltransferase [Methylosinus sp. H3A]
MEASRSGAPADGAATIAELYFLKPTDIKPVSYTFEPPPGAPRQSGEYEPLPTRIADARLIAAGASIDREGFELVEAPTLVEDFWNEEQMRAVYYPETERLLKQTLRARDVHIFDHTLRRRALPGPLSFRRSVEALPREPVGRTHVDQTLDSGPRRLREILGEAAERFSRRRFAIINVWRPLFGPVEDAPLAVCDARSVAARDLVACDLIFRDRRGETYALAYSPEQRWFYYPRMRRGEVLLLKCYDSRADVARFSPHTAFDDPATPKDARPRESIELRCFVAFDD